MTTFAITKAFISKNIGGVEKPYTPKIGENYRLYAEYSVTGKPKNPYHVLLSIADQETYLLISDLSPGTKSHVQEVFCPLDGTIPWHVEIDPWGEADADDTTKSKIPLHIPNIGGLGNTHLPPKPLGYAHKDGTFDPIAPSEAIEFYEPNRYKVTQSLIGYVKGKKISRIRCVMGIPTTDSWQKVSDLNCSVTRGKGHLSLTPQKVEYPNHYPVYLWDEKNLASTGYLMTQSAIVEVRNQRVNKTLLEKITWAQLDKVKKTGLFEAYTGPESVVESDDPKIAAYVKEKLGTNYRNNYTPYSASRKLFQSVVSDVEYFYPKPGQADLRGHTAVAMLKGRQGDCGGFSILLVALFRQIGFAARTACGAWDSSAGHCWSEQFFPKYGWMVSDGSLARLLSTSGDYAYYFGNLPNLNTRYACMRGNTFPIAGLNISWLQGPNGPNPDATVTAHKESASTSLQLLPASGATPPPPQSNIAYPVMQGQWTPKLAPTKSKIRKPK